MPDKKKEKQLTEQDKLLLLRALRQAVAIYPRVDRSAKARKVLDSALVALARQAPEILVQELYNVEKLSPKTPNDELCSAYAKQFEADNISMGKGGGIKEDVYAYSSFLSEHWEQFVRHFIGNEGDYGYANLYLQTGSKKLEVYFREALIGVEDLCQEADESQQIQAIRRALAVKESALIRVYKTLRSSSGLTQWKAPVATSSSDAAEGASRTKKRWMIGALVGLGALSVLGFAALAAGVVLTVTGIGSVVGVPLMAGGAAAMLFGMGGIGGVLAVKYRMSAVGNRENQPLLDPSPGAVPTGNSGGVTPISGSFCKIGGSLPLAASARSSAGIAQPAASVIESYKEVERQIIQKLALYQQTNHHPIYSDEHLGNPNEAKSQVNEILGLFERAAGCLPNIEGEDIYRLFVLSIAAQSEPEDTKGVYDICHSTENFSQDILQKKQGKRLPRMIFAIIEDKDGWYRERLPKFCNFVRTYREKIMLRQSPFTAMDSEMGKIIEAVYRDIRKEVAAIDAAKKTAPVSQGAHP